MKPDHITFTFKEPVPKELEGKTLKEVMEIVNRRTNEIVKKIKKIYGSSKYTKEVEEGLTKDEVMYLKICQMFKEIAKGDLSNVKFGIISPYM